MALEFKLRVGGFNKLSTIDSDGIAFAVYFQGCSIKCPGCHNPELQSKEGGTEYTPSEILEMIVKHRDWYDNVVFLGGEPLDQPLLPLVALINGIRKYKLGIWLYTGYCIDDVPTCVAELCDMIVAGSYVEDLKTGGFPASSNQTICDRRKQYEG